MLASQRQLWILQEMTKPKVSAIGDESLRRDIEGASQPQPPTAEERAIKRLADLADKAISTGKAKEAGDAIEPIVNPPDPHAQRNRGLGTISKF